MNKVILMGRLVADPELKTTPSGLSVTTVRVAVNRRFSADGTNTADFFDVVCWRQTADFVAKYFTKGRMIGVVGSLQTRSWTDKNGNKRYVTEVIADEAYFCGDKAEAETKAKAKPEAEPELTEVDDGEELPF